MTPTLRDTDWHVRLTREGNAQYRQYRYRHSLRALALQTLSLRQFTAADAAIAVALTAANAFNVASAIPNAAESGLDRALRQLNAIVERCEAKDMNAGLKTISRLEMGE